MNRTNSTFCLMLLIVIGFSITGYGCGSSMGIHETKSLEGTHESEPVISPRENPTEYPSPDTQTRGIKGIPSDEPAALPRDIHEAEF